MFREKAITVPPATVPPATAREPPIANIRIELDKDVSRNRLNKITVGKGRNQIEGMFEYRQGRLFALNFEGPRDAMLKNTDLIKILTNMSLMEDQNISMLKLVDSGSGVLVEADFSFHGNLITTLYTVPKGKKLFVSSWNLTTATEGAVQGECEGQLYFESPTASSVSLAVQDFHFVANNSQVASVTGSLSRPIPEDWVLKARAGTTVTHASGAFIGVIIDA